MVGAWLKWLAVVLLTILLPLASVAGRQPVAPEVVVNGNSVVVNGTTVLTLRTDAVDGSSPTDRAQTLARAIQSLPYFGEVKVRKVGQTHVIFAGGQRLLTITRAEARAHRSSTASLAVAWSGRLRSAFANPPLIVSTDPLTIATPSNRVIPMRGTLAGRAQVTTDNAAVASVQPVPGGFRLSGNAPGNAVISIVAGSITRTIPVTVRPLAAVFPQTFSAQVAGNPALASTVEGAAEAVIRQQMVRAPGSVLNIRFLPVEAVGDTGSRSVVARVRVSAPDTIDSEGQVTVVVRNVGPVFGQESELWYCNHPESIVRTGHLFAAELKRGRSTRMLYHHINESRAPMYLRVQAVNESDEPAQLLILPGDSDPDPNPVRAGLRAAAQFFRNWNARSGEVVTIPPKSSVPISFRRMGLKDTVSGLAGLRLLSGPEQLIVRTDALPLLDVESKWRDATNTTTPWRFTGANPNNGVDLSPFTLSPHVYPEPFKTAEIRYEYGKRYGFFRIGERPIPGQQNDRSLDGNFGVIYRIRAEISNPTNEVADIEVVFEASAGYSGALFTINGALKETRLLQPKAEYRIERVRLQPGETRRIDLVTIPLSGSSYPSLISVRPFQELSSGVSR